MSRDVNYILDYEVQSYTQPTPMELDKALILEDKPGTTFMEMHYGFVIFCELPKYSLSHETLAQLKADRIFEKVNGDIVQEATQEKETND